ncbi:MAG: elongation factor Ts, partial [Lentimonas sp.]
KQLVRDIAMHVAAVNPACVSRDDIDPAIIDKERKIAEGQAEGKPEQAIAKIVEGKLNKFLSESCLLEQAFVKNSDQTVQELLTSMISKMGENIVVKRFARFQVGA